MAAQNSLDAMEGEFIAAQEIAALGGRGGECVHLCGAKA